MATTTAERRSKYLLQKSYDALAEEHDQLLALLERLEAIRDVMDLRRPLEELHGLLVKHFAHEQFPGGLYDSMGAFGSTHDDLLRELIGEHCMLLSFARELLEQSSRNRKQDRAAMPGGVARLIQRLKSHERKEHRLAEMLVNRQVRTSDRK